MVRLLRDGALGSWAADEDEDGALVRLPAVLRRGRALIGRVGREALAAAVVGQEDKGGGATGKLGLCAFTM